MPGRTVTIRPAVPADTATIVAVVGSAYALYTPRIGRQPAPVSADYPSLVRAAEVWVAVDAADEPVGVLVMRPAGGSLFIENVASIPATSAAESAACCCPSPNSTAANSGCPPSPSTRMRA